MPKSTKSSAPCTISTPPVSSPLPPPATTSVSCVVDSISQPISVPSSVSDESRGQAVCSEPVARESGVGMQCSNTQALYHQFVHFMNSRDPNIISHSVPSLMQDSRSVAPVLLSAPTVCPESVNPPLVVPGLNSEVGFLASDSRPIRSSRTNNSATLLRGASGLGRSAYEGRSGIPPSRSAIGGGGVLQRLLVCNFIDRELDLPQ